ncbi:Hypothetical predicted protein [Octopus vulgaris]|uniref:Uncharacterized protein n=1 Tax=Octopus vulgaris TaxID=6645 RepID=A0AA36APG1_OCTVU|nr:Hypothetical predicted protein [Octopus vulgaris]
MKPSVCGPLFNNAGWKITFLLGFRTIVSILRNNRQYYSRKKIGERWHILDILGTNNAWKFSSFLSHNIKEKQKFTEKRKERKNLKEF